MGRWYKGDVVLDPDIMWKKNLSGRYWVSEYGDVINAETGFRLRTEPQSSGYVRVGHQVCRGRGVHCAVYEAFVGEIPLGMQINHLDGDKENNHLSNLELCTPAENIRHAYATGLNEGVKGEANHYAKVTSGEVLQMYEMFKLGYPNKHVGDIFGLHDRYISLVRHGRRWKWLFEEQSMYETVSLGRLKYPLPQCVYIYNKCMTSRIPQDELGKLLGIDSSQVSRIRTGKGWSQFREFFSLPATSLDWKESGSSLTVDFKREEN